MPVEKRVMTKAECIIEDLGFRRNTRADYYLPKHNGAAYIVRVWALKIEDSDFEIHCDNYYGRSVLYQNGNRLGDYEVIYEEIPRVVKARAKGILA